MHSAEKRKKTVEIEIDLERSSESSSSIDYNVGEGEFASFAPGESQEYRVPVDERCKKQIPITHFQKMKKRITLQSLNQKALLSVREQLNSPRSNKRSKTNCAVHNPNLRSQDFSFTSRKVSLPRLPKLQMTTIKHPGDIGVTDMRTPPNAATELNPVEQCKGRAPVALLNTLRKYRKTAKARESFRRAVVKILEQKKRASIEWFRARVEEIDRRNAPALLAAED